MLTNSLTSNDMLPAHSGYAKTRRRLLENGMELYELRPDTDAFRPGWSLLSGRSPETPIGSSNVHGGAKADACSCPEISSGLESAFPKVKH